MFDAINWRRQWHPTPVLMPGKSIHAWMEEPGSDTTERLHFHFSLTRIGEGNGNPLQCSCLENPRDEGAWWAAVYGVAQSRTRLKRLSSSSRGKKKHIKRGAKGLGVSFSPVHALVLSLFSSHLLGQHALMKRVSSSSSSSPHASRMYFPLFLNKTGLSKNYNTGCPRAVMC